MTTSWPVAHLVQLRARALVAVLMLLIVACGGSETTSEPTQAAEPTRAPTAEPTPAPTATATPVVEPPSAPAATATPVVESATPATSASCPEYQGVTCQGFVTDAAGVLQDRLVLEEVLEDLVLTYGHEVAVVIVDNAPGGVQDFAEGVGEAWVVKDRDGQAGGVVLVIDPSERDLWITAGPTLQSVIPAATDLVEVAGPSFRQDDYDTGIAAMAAMLAESFRAEFGVEVIELPSNFSERGPYAVGVITRSLGDRDVEIWYPVEPDAVVGQPTEVFDALSAFPENLRAIVPPELSGEYDTLAVRDAPGIAQEFPVVIYGHGFGGYRQIATHFTSHLASWGFVVASTDHLERGIAEQTLDLVGSGLFDESNSRPDAAVADVRNTIDLLRELNDDGPLAGSLDLEQLAISGHSAGAFAAVQAAAAEPELIDGWISVSGGTADGIELSQPGLVVIGELDAVVPAERSYGLYESAGTPQVLLNIEGAGHNSFTDPCRGILDLGGLGALTALLGEEQVARAQDGCTPEATSPEVAQAMVNHVAVAWLSELFGVPVAGEPLALDYIATLGPIADYQAD